MIVAAILRRGLIAGLVAGAALALVLFLVGEPRIHDAAALDDATHAATPSLSSGVQSIGGSIGAILLGGALGVVFSVVFAATRHVLPGRNDWSRAAALAGIAFVTIFFVPSMKYPANLPGAGDPDMASSRTRLYLVAVLWSVVSVLAAWRFTKAALKRGLMDYMGTPIGIASWGVLVATGMALLPSTENVTTPPGSLEFRIAAGVGGLTLWLVLGVLFGWLCSRANRQDEFPSQGFQP